MSNLAKFFRRCRARFDLYIGGVVVDVVLPVLMQRQASAFLVSFPVEVPQIQFFDVLGFQFGLVDVH